MSKNIFVMRGRLDQVIQSGEFRQYVFQDFQFLEQGDADVGRAGSQKPGKLVAQSFG